MKTYRFWFSLLLLIAVSFPCVEAGILLRQIEKYIDPMSMEVSKTMKSGRDALSEVHMASVNIERTEAEMSGLLNTTRHSMITAKQQQQLIENATMLLSNANAA